MSNLEKIIFTAIRHVVVNEADYDFPEFISAVIASSSIRPWHLSEHLGISRQRFFSFQNKKYFRKPREKELEKIAEYFGIPQDLLARKANEYRGDDQ